MRKKAEKEIRSAAASLGDKLPFYSIAQVREMTGLIRKVFDKTILDMARLQTIDLIEGNPEEMSDVEIGYAIQQSTTVYVAFIFIDSDDIAPSPVEPLLPDPNMDSDNTASPPESPSPVESLLPEPNPSAKSGKLNITLRGIDRSEWEQFEFFCRTREGKKPVQKIWELIREYNRVSDYMLSENSMER